MSKNMTKARILAFINELGAKRSELNGRSSTVEEDDSDYRKFAVERFPVMEDPDAELMREVMGLLGEVRERTGRQYELRTPRPGRWALIEWDGDCRVYVGSADKTLEQLRDKLKEMLPPPVPTLEEAARAARLQDDWARGQLTVKEGGNFDRRLKTIDAYFDDAIEREAEGEGGK